MRILVACEESQIVCQEFRLRGHEAYSCDIIECSGEHPEWHIKSDVLPLLNGHCTFETMDGTSHQINQEWDMIIAFPPCTYLTVAGNRWFNEERYGEKAVQRKKDRVKAIDFFMKIADANCERICIENPVGVMSTEWRKPDQIIHPYYFAKFQDDENCERKGTCFWLKGLPCLTYEIKFEPRIVKYKNGKTDSLWHMKTFNLPAKDRAKARSRTFPGVAAAMADQWADLT